MNPMGKKELRIMVRIKLAMSRATEAYTMACMVDLPTPTAPFVVFSPSRQESYCALYADAKKINDWELD